MFRLVEGTNIVGEDVICPTGALKNVPAYEYSDAFGEVPLTLENSVAAPFNGMRVYGRSEQFTTTGAQLLNTDELIPGHYSTAGVFDANASYRISMPKISIPSGETKLSVSDLAQGIFLLYCLFNSEGKLIHRQAGYNKQAVITLIPDTAFIGLSFYFADNSKVTADMLQSCMVNFGDIKTWEPYTGGRPSPNPEYPQEIEHVGEKGNIEVGVRGKNLIDYTKAKGDADIQFVDGGFIVGGDERNRIINLPCNIQKGKSYTIDFKENHLLGNNDVNCYLPGGRYSVSGNAPQYYGIIKKRPFIANDDYTAFGIYHDIKTVSVSKSEVTDICLVKTGIDTSYEPYVEPQYLTLKTPNGLPGVPVTTGGNYTDRNGQQYICDEIDLGRGKYVQRVKDFIINQNTKISTSMGTYGAPEKDTILARYLDRTIKKNGAILCRELIHMQNWNVDSESVNTTETSIDFRLSRKRLGLGTETTTDENKTAVLKFLETTPLHCLVELNTPIERDLTPEEIEAYGNLTANDGTTVIDIEGENIPTYVSATYPVIPAYGKMEGNTLRVSKVQSEGFKPIITDLTTYAEAHDSVFIGYMDRPDSIARVYGANPLDERTE